MRSILLIVCLVPGIAAAQPAPPTGPVSTDPAAPPAVSPPSDPASQQEPLVPPPTACEEELALVIQTAARISDPAERSRILRGAPDCTRGAHAIVGMQRRAPTPIPTRKGAFGEFGFGVALASVSGGGSSDAGLAIALGGGGFVSSQVGLSLRVAGRVNIENGTGFNGFIGPTAQFWASQQLFVGGGLGLGISAASCDSCQIYKSLGFDGRVGYALSPGGHGANISLEVTHNTIDYNDEVNGVAFKFRITTMIFEVSYLMF